MLVETWNGHKQTPTWFVFAGDYPVCLRVGDNVISRSSNDSSPPDSSIQLALSSFLDFLFEHFIRLTSISLFFFCLTVEDIVFSVVFFILITCIWSVMSSLRVITYERLLWQLHLWWVLYQLFPQSNHWWSYDKGKCLCVSIHSLGNDDFLSCLLTFTNWKYVMGAFAWLLSWCRIWHAWNRKCNKINWHEIKLFSWKL